MNTEKPSKSAKKREHLALQDLGEALTRLGPSELEAVPLDDRLMQAVMEARSMNSRGALRRQRQLIGKLMRTADAAAIRASLARLGQSDRQQRQLFHSAENWRDRICLEGAPAIAAFAATTGCAAQKLEEHAAELAATVDDDRRRSIRRRIFREVHAGLAGRAAADPGS